jgi:RNA polymerase sigma-70 factor (ECF subfamily)
MPNDIAIERAKKNNRNALNDVMIKSSPFVYNLCQKWCSPPLESEDVAQNALIKISKNIKNFRHESKFSTWVYTVTYNVFLDEYRKIKRRQSIATMQSIDSNGIQFESETSTFSANVESNDSSEILQNALQELSFDHRAILLLIDVEQLSYVEAANELNIEVGTVRSRLARARISFKKILDKQGTLSPFKGVKTINKDEGK